MNHFKFMLQGTEYCDAYTLDFYFINMRIRVFWTQVIFHLQGVCPSCLNTNKLKQRCELDSNGQKIKDT